MNLFVLFLSFSLGAAPLKDNVLFAFEKCKTLKADLDKGQLREESVAGFDLHCFKQIANVNELKCIAFDPGTDRKLNETVMTGGSELGEATLTDMEGAKIRFLIGKTYASYENPNAHKVCIGIHLFEEDAKKKK